MRVLVNGILSFGLVNVPVGVASVASRKETSFKTLCKQCGEPIKLVKTCPTHGADVETMRGFEYASGEYLVLTDEEIESAQGAQDKMIRLSSFAMSNNISPLLIEKNYWLAPNKVMGEAYWLLHDALLTQDAVGLGSCALWGKGTPCMVACHSPGLTLSTLFCADEIAQTDFQYNKSSVEAQKLAESLVRDSTKLFTLDGLRSGSRACVEALVQSKLAGMVFEPSAQDVTPVAKDDDVLEMLKASLAEQKPKRKVRA